MWDPNTLYHFGKVRQQGLIERGQQSARARDAESRRQRALIAWRKNQKPVDQLQPLEPVAIRFLRRIMIAFINRGSLA